MMRSNACFKSSELELSETANFWVVLSHGDLSGQYVFVNMKVDNGSAMSGYWPLLQTIIHKKHTCMLPCQNVYRMSGFSAKSNA